MLAVVAIALVFVFSAGFWFGNRPDQQAASKAQATSTTQTSAPGTESSQPTNRLMDIWMDAPKTAEPFTSDELEKMFGMSEIIGASRARSDAILAVGLQSGPQKSGTSVVFGGAVKKGGRWVVRLRQTGTWTGGIVSKPADACGVEEVPTLLSGTRALIGGCITGGSNAYGVAFVVGAPVGGDPTLMFDQSCGVTWLTAYGDELILHTSPDAKAPRNPVIVLVPNPNETAFWFTPKSATDRANYEKYCGSSYPHDSSNPLITAG